MHRRCTDPLHPSYDSRGGRGIFVCDRWSGPMGYTHFVEDMGEPPAGLTLGLIRSDLDYGPGNCQYVTWAEQAANRPRNGPPRKPDSLAGLCRAASLPYMLVYHRIHSLGWSQDCALSTPVGPRGRRSFVDMMAPYEHGENKNPPVSRDVNSEAL